MNALVVFAHPSRDSRAYSSGVITGSKLSAYRSATTARWPASARPARNRSSTWWVKHRWLGCA